MDYVWGDNESMINSSIVPDAKLYKRHNILSFHFVRSMVSRRYINMLHIASKYNFADILIKHWNCHGTYHELVQPVFHHKGNTVVLFLEDTLEVDLFINEDDSKTRFVILGSDRTLCQPQNTTLVCG